MAGVGPDAVGAGVSSGERGGRERGAVQAPASGAAMSGARLAWRDERAVGARCELRQAKYRPKCPHYFLSLLHPLAAGVSALGQKLFVTRVG